MREPNKWYEITIDAGQVSQKAFNTFNIQKAKLKCFDICIEAEHGYGEAEIEYVDFVFEPKTYSGYVIYQSLACGAIVFIGLTLISMLLKDKREIKTPNIMKVIGSYMHGLLR